VKKELKDVAEAEITTVEIETETEVEIETNDEDLLTTTNASDATALVIGLHLVLKEEIAVGAKNAIRTEEKANALSAAEKATNKETAGEDPLAHRDLTRAIDETEDHVAEADLPVELQNDTDAVDTTEMIEEIDLILQTAVAMIDTTDAVVEEVEVLSTGETANTTVEVLAADLFPIPVRAPPDHPQGKKLVDRNNTPKVAASAEAKVNIDRANRGLIPRAKNLKVMVNRKTTTKTTT